MVFYILHLNTYGICVCKLFWHMDAAYLEQLKIWQVHVTKWTRCKRGNTQSLFKVLSCFSGFKPATAHGAILSEFYAGLMEAHCG